MSGLSAISGVPAADVSSTPQYTAREVQVVHSDGTTETVYLMEVPQGKKPLHQHVHSHLLLVYVFIGTIALALSAYLSYKQLKHSK
jgi:hypothetical protein